MQRITSAIALGAAAGLALSSAFLALARTSSEGLARSPIATRAANTQMPTHDSAAPGMVIYRDPVTGAFGMPPPGTLEAPSTAPPSDSSRARAGWRETADPRPGAGWRLEGPGMFTTMTATVGADGKVSVDCDRPERGAGR